ALVHTLGVIQWRAQSITDLERVSASVMKLVPTVATALVHQDDLRRVLHSGVFDAAKAGYTPASPPRRFRKFRPTGSVLEAVSNEFGLQLRNVFYADRCTPFDGDVVEAAAKAKSI